MTMGVYSSRPHILGTEYGTCLGFPRAERDKLWCRITAQGIIATTTIIAVAVARLLNLRRFPGPLSWRAGVFDCEVLRFVKFIVCSNPVVVAWWWALLRRQCAKTETAKLRTALWRLILSASCAFSAYPLFWLVIYSIPPACICQVGKRWIKSRNYRALKHIRSRHSQGV